MAIGVATFFRMPPSPTQTRTWYRPNGWFTPREERIIVNRVLRDDPTKASLGKLYRTRKTHILTMSDRVTCIIAKD